jgi:hypothetical protein
MNIVYPRNPMQIVLNLAIQTEEFAPDNSTSFPSQMEVDWVRYYQRHQCQNVNITDPSQFPINNQVLNVIVGENIFINCNFTIQPGQQLDLVAKNSIIMGPGFNANTGSISELRIEPTVCGSSMQFNDIEFFKDTPIVEKLQVAMNTTSLSLETEIKIYPNPNEGLFVIDFGSNNYQDFNVKIKNSEGQSVYNLDKPFSNYVTINMANKAKGAYVLYLYNTKNLSLITHKIIFQ